MLAAKFVTKDLVSPGALGTIDYSSFGVKIATKADPEYYKMQGRGIYAAPLDVYADLSDAIPTEHIVVLDIDPQDIAYNNGGRSMRLSAVTPLGVLTPDSVWWSQAMGSPQWAYHIARYVAREPSQETRTAASGCPRMAYYYALDVDGGPTPATRHGASRSPEWATHYARDIDKMPTSETSSAAFSDNNWKNVYSAFLTVYTEREASNQ